MTEIFGVTYYVTFLSPFLFVFGGILLIVIALVILRTKWGVRIAVAISALAIYFVVVFLDVYQIGQEATRLCKEEGGLHIYKSMEANGFIGASDIAFWSKYGFEYLETSKNTYDPNLKRRVIEKYKVTIRDGKPSYEQIDEFISRYTLGPGVKPPYTITSPLRLANIKSSKITRHMDRVIDRETGEVLGELIFFSIGRGKIDKFTPFEFTPWFCGRADPDNIGQNLGLSSVILKTLKPGK